MSSNRRGQVGMQDLEGDHTLVFGVFCQIHGGHATPADLSLDPVAIT